MTRYVASPLGTPRIERQRIPAGFAGTKRTAAHVARLIREGSSDFFVRQKAIDILLAGGVTPKDYLGEIEALFRWVQRHVRYTKDPFRVEVLHSPRRMLELRAGDCDDMAILLGALVKSVGHPVRLVLTGPNASRPDLFSHIYLEAQHQGDWIPLDATMPFDMGWSPRAPVRLVLPIDEDSNDDHADTRTTASASSALPAGAADSAGPRAGARVAPRAAPRHPHAGSAAARSARESALGPAPASSTAGPRRVDADDVAPRVGKGAGPAAPPAHNEADARATQELGRAERTTTAATAAGRSRHDGPGTPGKPSVPSSAAGHDSPGRHSPAGADLAAASALYRRFTRFPASSLTRVPHRRLIPPVVVDLGRLMAVVYRSPKWVGRPRTYIHRMEDPPRLVCDVDGRRLFVVGGSYRITEQGIEG